MGALADLRTNRKTFKVGSPLDQWAVRQIKRLNNDNGAAGDIPVETLAAAADGVYAQAQSTQSSGNHTLTVTIRQSDGSVETFTTGNIAFDAVAATVESAIDSAATTASVTDWTNADISVGGTSVDDASGLTYTFDGASVTERPVTVELTDVDGAGGAWGAVTATTRGQLQRSAWSILLSYGIIESTIPEQDAAASLTSVTKGTGTETNLLPAVIVKQLMMEAAAEDDNNGAYFSLEKALMRQDRSPLVESRLTGDADVHNA